MDLLQGRTTIIAFVFYCIIFGASCQRYPSPWQDRIDHNLMNLKILNSNYSFKYASNLPSYEHIITKLADDNNSDLLYTNDVSLNPRCIGAVIIIANMLKDLANNTWVMQMIDAAGKPRSGILEGTTLFIGRNSECLGIEVPAKYKFQTQMCAFSLSVAPNGSHISSDIVGAAAPKLTLSVALCVPDVCNATDVEELTNYALQKYESDIGLHLVAAGTFCPPTAQEWDTKAIVAIVIYSIFAIFLLSGTAYDLLIHQPSLKAIDIVVTEGDKIVNAEESEHIAANNHQYLPISNHISDIKKAKESYIEQISIVGSILLAFSVYSNGKKILHAQHGAGQLECIHGIRFLSMSWVILGHTYVFGIGLVVVC